MERYSFLFLMDYNTVDFQREGGLCYFCFVYRVLILLFIVLKVLMRGFV